MNVEIEDAIKRVRAYWFVDGFTEMAAGAFFILLALLFVFSRKLAPASFTPTLLSLASEIALAKAAGGLAAILILWWLKDHFTYPRTGIARGPRITLSQVLVILRNAVLFLLLPTIAVLAACLLLTSTNRILAALPVVFPVALAVIWSALFLLAAEWTGIARFRIVAGLTLLAGIAIGIWESAAGLPGFSTDLEPPLSPLLVVESINRMLMSLGILVFSCGAALACSGIVVFLRYRKENPWPYTEGA